MKENSPLSILEDLGPMIRARREEIEKARCLPRDLVEQLRKTGLFSLGVPRAIGGKEARPHDMMRAIETVASADGSTGWCTMAAIMNNLAAGYMNEAGAREVFADPTVPSTGIAAPLGTAEPVDGGLRVNGRWTFASGITHSDWVWAGCVVMDHGSPRMTPHGPEIAHVCMPVIEISIHDTWHVSGLRGTGSHDFSARDVFVPGPRVFALLDPSGHRPEPLYRMPPMALFVAQVASVSLGIARGALDELNELARTKVPSLYTHVLADRPAAQMEIMRAEAALRAARAFLHEAVEDMWQTVCGGGDIARRQIALVRAAATHGSEVAAAVTRTASTLGGGSALYQSSSLQQHARDPRPSRSTSASRRTPGRRAGGCCWGTSRSRRCFSRAARRLRRARKIAGRRRSCCCLVRGSKPAARKSRMSRPSARPATALPRHELPAYARRSAPAGGENSRRLRLTLYSARTVHVFTCPPSPMKFALLLCAGALALGPLRADSRLTNVSVRSTAGSGADTLIVGFTISGTGAKSVLLRGVGPTLAAFEVTGAANDSELRLFNAGGVSIADNDNWGRLRHHRGRSRGGRRFHAARQLARRRAPHHRRGRQLLRSCDR